VFGRFVVCKDRPTMEAVAASGAPVDAITLDGDVMRRKGTLSGGYVNNARSKFNTYKQVRHRLVRQHCEVALMRPAVRCCGEEC
jgi:chromosome segregation ATPase